MATSCNVGMQNADGTYRVAYIGSDGYLAGVGAKLLIHYNDSAKISALIDLGRMSPLYGTIEETIADNMCYDPDEILLPDDYPYLLPTREAMIAEQPADFLWEDGRWLYLPYDEFGTPLPYVPLTRELVMTCDTGMGQYVEWPE